MSATKGRQWPRPERWTAPCSRTKTHRQTSSRWMTSSRWKRVTWGTFPRLCLKQEITRNTGQSKPCSEKDWLGSKSLSKANKDWTFYFKHNCVFTGSPVTSEEFTTTRDITRLQYIKDPPIT